MKNCNAELLGLATLAGIAAWQQRSAAARRAHLHGPPSFLASHRPSIAESASRQVYWAAAFLLPAAFTDLAVERYRGSFHNKTMYVPLAASAATLAASVR